MLLWMQPAGMLTVGWSHMGSSTYAGVGKKINKNVSDRRQGGHLTALTQKTAEIDESGVRGA